MKRTFGKGLGAIGTLLALSLVMSPSSASAAFMSADNLVVVRLGSGAAPYAADSAAAVFLDEYNVSGPAPVLVQSVSIPSTGAAALTMASSSLYHDGHLTRSVDGYSLTLTGYRQNAGPGDPVLAPAAAVNRVIGLVGTTGSVDTTTGLNASYEQTAIRGAATVDGSRFWVVGDNAGGATTSGGLRYVAAVGSSTSVNLSQTQSIGGFNSPDNIRSVGIFDNQLYDSSGSSASVGKAVFKVGTGLPTSDAQPLTKLNTDNISDTSFFLADLSASVAGVDTLYATTDLGIKKFSLVGSTWTANGSIALPVTMGTGESLTGKLDGQGGVSLFASGRIGVIKFNDITGYNAAVSGSPTVYLAAAPETEFRGVAFAPMPFAGDANADKVADFTDLGILLNNYNQPGNFFMGDFNNSGLVDFTDLGILLNNYNQHVPTLSAAAPVPEPTTLALAACGAFGLLIVARRQR